MRSVRFSAAADQDLRAALLNRTRHVERALYAEELPFERRPVFREHELGDLHRLVQAVHATRDGRKVDAIANVLVLIPRGTDPEDGATPGDDVEGRDLFGQQRRIAIGDAGDQGSELDARSPRRDGGERRVGLEHRVGLRTDATDLIEVVHHGDEVETGGLSRLRLLDHMVEQLVVGNTGERVVGHVKTEESSHV